MASSRLVFAAGIVYSTAFAADSAGFAVSNVFGDGCVLQRDQPAVVWGFGAEGSKVTATLDGHTVACPIGNDDVWRCTFPAKPAGGPYTITFATSSGQSTLISDVLFGDVYIASGQSNMQFSLPDVLNASVEIADAGIPGKYPTLRIFQAAATRGTSPHANFSSVALPWSPVNSTTVAGNWDITHQDA